MDIRYSCNQKDFKRYTTEEIRKEFLIEKLFTEDQVTAVYSHVDRMVTLGVMPVTPGMRHVQCGRPRQGDRGRQTVCAGL